MSFIRVRCFMVLAAALLSACVKVDTVPPAAFTSHDEAVVFDLRIDQWAGNIDLQGLRKLMASDEAVIEADYMPTRTLWLINAHLAVHWDGQVIPVPRWVLTPDVKTVRLKPQDYQLTEAGGLRFTAKRIMGTGYALHGVRVVLPGLPTLPNVPVEPLRLEVALAPAWDAAPTAASTTLTSDVHFVFDSIRYAVRGTFKASNAYLVMSSDDNMAVDTGSPASQAALVGSRYGAYQKALQRQDVVDAHVAGLSREARAMEPGDRRADESASGNWAAMSIDTPYPAPPDATVLENRHVQAKADGHMLDNVTLEIRHGEAIPVGACGPWDRYELFFVDRRLVTYQRRQNACTHAGQAHTSLTHARWNDQGEPVYFHRLCEPCAGIAGVGVQAKADGAAWAAMERFGDDVATKVLRSADVFPDH